MQMEQNPYVEEIAFDSAEEMIEWMATQRAQVDARPLAEEQLGIGWGDYGVRFYEDLIIFAQVETRESLAAEDRETREEIEARFAANSLWCKCYSVITPDGEYGYLHRSVLWPIPATAFASAQKVGFDFLSMSEVARFDVESAWHRHQEFLSRQH